LSVSTRTHQLAVEIVTHSGVIYQQDVDGIIAPGTVGYLGVRPGHAPLVTSLGTGVITVHVGERDLFGAITGGIMEVFQNRVTILADVAEMASAIDVERARRAVKRASQRLEAHYSDGKREEIDADRAQMALLRALNRLRTAEKAGLR